MGSFARELRWGGVLVVSLLVACGEEPPPAAPVARPVKIFEVAGPDATRAREYPGEVTASTNTKLGFEVAGKLVAFPVLESQKVARGDVLARLDPRDFEESLNAVKASARAAEADLDRYRVLYSESVASKQELEKAERNYDVYKANQAKAEKALEDTVLRAPFDGVVARKLVDDFANVQAKEPIVTLQTGADLEIVVNLPEQDYVRLKPGVTVDEINESLEAYVEVSAIPGRRFAARLKEFATTADPVTRTFPVTFSFDGPDDVSVLPGMTAKVTGVGQNRAGANVVIPVQATAEEESGQVFVWVVDPDSWRARKAPVTLGRLTAEGVEVNSGVGPGDWIAISGVHQLREGMEVRRAGS